MKVPTIDNARNQWNITKIDVSQYDQSIDSMRVILQQKYTNILNDIKTNNYIIGLNQYNLSKEEIYAIHMMLILNENIILQEENSYVKYVYINADMKANLTINNAYGLYWLSEDISQYIYTRYKMLNDDKVYQDICFILNTLIGYAYQHKSSISNQNIFNIYTLAKQLFMHLDQFLIALTVLKIHKIIDFQILDHNLNYKFKFCEYISNYIESQLFQAKQIDNNQNEIKEKLFINISDNNLDVLSYINYIKKNCNNEYILLSLTDIKDNLHRVRLKNQICHHSHIIFQPHNFDSDKKIMYAYQYIEDTNKKFNNFADYCIFRFVPHRFVKVLSYLWIKYGIQVDFINTMLFLDACYKKLDYAIFVKVNSNVFKSLGMTDYGDFINIVNVLISTELIEVNNLRVTNKMISFQIKLKNNYFDLKYEELLSTLDNNMSHSIKKIIQFNNSGIIPNDNNEDINLNKNNNININSSSLKEENNNFDKENNNQQLNESINIKEENYNEKLLDNINIQENNKQLNDNNNIIEELKKQNEKLIIDNSYLLTQLAQIHNFNNKDLNRIQLDISTLISILINNIIKELQVKDINIINSQKNIIKLILNLEDEINKLLI